MKASDASGDGLSAASARTQSRQRGEQNLLADTRGSLFRESEVIGSSLPSTAWQKEQRNRSPFDLRTWDGGVAPRSTACSPGGGETHVVSTITALPVEVRWSVCAEARVQRPVPRTRRPIYHTIVSTRPRGARPSTSWRRSGRIGRGSYVPAHRSSRKTRAWQWCPSPGPVIGGELEARHSGQDARPEPSVRRVPADTRRQSPTADERRHAPRVNERGEGCAQPSPRVVAQALSATGNDTSLRAETPPSRFPEPLRARTIITSSCWSPGFAGNPC